MGIEILFMFGIVVFVPAIFLVFVGGWWIAGKKSGAVETAWRTYARTRKLDLVVPADRWPHHHSPLVRWAHDGASYRMETLGQPSLRTRVSARVEAAAPGELVVTGTGDITSELPSGLASAIFTPEVRRRVLGFGRTASLTYVDGEILFDWPDAEVNPARLDEARAVVECVVRAVASGCDLDVARA